MIRHCLSEVYYLHEVCHSAVIHTTALYSECKHNKRGYEFCYLALELDTGEPSVKRTHKMQLSLPDCTASFWDLARQSVEQYMYVTNGPSPLFLEYYAMD